MSNEFEWLHFKILEHKMPEENLASVFDRRHVLVAKKIDPENHEDFPSVYPMTL